MTKILLTIFCLLASSVAAYAGPYGPGGSGSVSHNQSAASDWRFGALNVGTGASPGQIKQDGSNNLEFYDPVVGTWWTLHQLSSGAAGNMIYPTAGIAVSSGSAWGTPYSASNPIPYSMLSVTPANLGLAIGTNVEAWSSVLDTFKGVAPSTGYLYWTGSGFQYQTPSSAAWGAITGTLANQSDLQTALNGKQAASTNLTTYSGIAPSANAQTLLGETFSQMLSSIGAQAASTNLTTWSGINPGTGVGTALSSGVNASGGLLGYNGNLYNIAQLTPSTGYLYWNGSAFVYQATGGSSYTFSNSLVNSSGTVTLSGDSAAPGNSMYYGTNSSGTKGWNSLTNQSGSVGSFASVNVGSNLSSSTETPVAQWYCTDSASNTVLCGELTLQMTSNTSGAVSTVLRRYGLTTGSLTSLESTTTQTIASGAAALGTSAIAAGACSTVVSVAATGVLATDAVNWSFNAAPSTGYNGSGGAGLGVSTYVTSGNVNFLVCNPTASSITPAAATLNWRVVR